MSRRNESYHTCMSHVTCDYVLSHLEKVVSIGSVSYLAHQNVIIHMNESCHMNESNYMGMSHVI